jgi:hypothetical protein
MKQTQKQDKSMKKNMTTSNEQIEGKCSNDWKNEVNVS